MRGDLESASKNTSNPTFQYPKYSNIRIFENSLASDLVFVIHDHVECARAEDSTCASKMKSCHVNQKKKLALSFVRILDYSSVYQKIS